MALTDFDQIDEKVAEALMRRALAVVAETSDLPKLQKAWRMIREIRASVAERRRRAELEQLREKKDWEGLCRRLGYYAASSQIVREMLGGRAPNPRESLAYSAGRRQAVLDLQMVEMDGALQGGEVKAYMRSEKGDLRG